MSSPVEVVAGDEASLLSRQLPGTELHDAMELAGKLLARRARSVAEVRERLERGGFESDIVAATIDRLTELRLVDDFAFARIWVAERADRKGLGPGALVAELATKGVSHEIAEEVVAEVRSGEGPRAAAVAERLAARVGRLPLRDQAARIHAGLLRRGFSEETAEEATRAVLPPEGWD